MLADVQYTVRSLLRAPAFTLGAVLTFVLGAGVNVAIFAIVDRVLFRPLPYSRVQELVTIHPVNAKTGEVYFTLPKSLIVETRSTIPAMRHAGYAGNTRPYYFDGADQPPYQLTESSFNLLDVLGVQPTIGRTFMREDARDRRRVVLLRAEAVHSRLGGVPQAVGRQFTDRLGAATLVGILPAGFIIPSVNWATASDGLILAPDTLESAAPRDGMPAAVARLEPDETASGVEQRLNAALELSSGAMSDRTRIRVEPIQEGMFWNCRAPLSLVFAGGILVWLIACVNLGALMAVRTLARTSEFVVRASLGATRSRLARLILIESVLLTAAGCAAALAALNWTLRGIVAAVPSFATSLAVTDIDGRVLAFAGIASLVGACLAGIYPAWLLRRAALVVGRDEPSPRWSLTGARGLLSFECAITASLGITAVLTAQSFVGLLTTNLGFDPDLLSAVPIAATASSETNSGMSMQQLARELQAEPQIADVAFVDSPVFSGEVGPAVSFDNGAIVRRRQVSESYFRVMRTRIVAGRAFVEADDAGRVAVAILSVSAVRQQWPGMPVAEALGRQVHASGDHARVVVGVVEDTRPRHGLSSQSELFVPLDTRRLRSSTAVIRSRGPGAPDPLSLRRTLRVALGPSVQVGPVVLASSVLSPWLRNPKLYMQIFGSFAIVSVMLSAVGLFALVSYEASARQKEVGIRMSLGATNGQIVRLFLRGTLGPVLIGCAGGIGLSVVMARIIERLLFNVEARNALAYGVVAGSLLVTGAIAAFHPARKAARVDPAALLRSR